jgi:hypothetical protein
MRRWVLTILAMTVPGVIVLAAGAKNRRHSSPSSPLSWRIRGRGVGPLTAGMTERAALALLRRYPVRISRSRGHTEGEDSDQPLFYDDVRFAGKPLLSLWIERSPSRELYVEAIHVTDRRLSTQDGVRVGDRVSVLARLYGVGRSDWDWGPIVHYPHRPQLGGIVFGIGSPNAGDTSRPVSTVWKDLVRENPRVSAIVVYDLRPVATRTARKDPCERILALGAEAYAGTASESSEADVDAAYARYTRCRRKRNGQLFEGLPKEYRAQLIALRTAFLEYNEGAASTLLIRGGGGTKYAHWQTRAEAAVEDLLARLPVLRARYAGDTPPKGHDLGRSFTDLERQVASLGTPAPDVPLPPDQKALLRRYHQSWARSTRRLGDVATALPEAERNAVLFFGYRVLDELGGDTGD